MGKGSQEGEKVTRPEVRGWYVGLRDQLRDLEKEMEALVSIAGTELTSRDDPKKKATKADIASVDRMMVAHYLTLGTKLKESFTSIRLVLENLNQKQEELEKLAEKLTIAIVGIQKFEPLFQRLADLVEKEETEKTKYR